MRLIAPALIAAGLAAPASAGVEEAVTQHILPRQDAFAQATATLDTAAQGDCTAAKLEAPYQEAFDAWARVGHIRLGPIEEDGRALAIAFWPDTRGMVAGTLRDLLADQPPEVADPAEFAEFSVAARGLFALERLIYDPDFRDYGADDYACTLARAVTADLARMAAEIDAEWPDYATTLTTAGEAGNSRYLSRDEAAQALFTVLLTGLEFDADQRIGRPLGSFERPRPARAEAWRAGRSLRNVVLSLESLRDLAQRLTDAPVPETLAAFDRAIAEAQQLNDPVFAGVEDPQGRFEAEILQQRIQAVRRAVETEIGPRLGVAAGFNSMDGD
ncbi:imelysin family protein [Mesobaculum littorinae]|uniref:imelysin family protein n=1 Tax=Mesobaculum littorinae TaxID=2486419 RepID=UPI001F167F4F|nr:imelysin family protein [Mesobaculum littorinae]